jgi:hypothetical protein
MKDHAMIMEDLKKENDGEFIKKKFLSMNHLVIYHKRTEFDRKIEGGKLK